ARGAGVLLGDPAEPTLLVSTDRIVQAMDGAQHRAGQGPAWDAYGSDAPVSTAGPAADDRWPRLRPLVPAGTQALLAVPLPGAAGVLTLIGTPALTGSRQLRRAQAFAAAGAAMLREHAAIGDLRRQVGQLEAGLDARAPIEQAKGILMGRYGLDAAGAFAELSRRSQCSNVKVREVARRLVAEVCRVLPPDLPDWDEPLPEGTAGTGPPEFHLTPP
ncbi:MAG TPA: ANTAR domain-containing protein, partial [Mycobacteriales bacterium]|nr:ANTAR domain-containing protein [Mycobacteriales bacterium]